MNWKYDLTGQCVDMPNEPAESDFRANIRLRAYPTVEMGGIIWTYMGGQRPQAKEGLPGDAHVGPLLPPEPRFDFTQVPQNQRQVTKTWEECNWLQGLEGGIDTAHAGIMHRVLPTSSGQVMGTAGYWLTPQAVELEVHPSDYGYLYTGSRPQGDQGSWVRAYHFVMPWTQIRPSQDSGVGERHETISGHFWVPMDDENHMVWNWYYRLDGPIEDWDAREPNYPGGEQLEGFRKARNRDNRWLIDRELQKKENFTGIEGINTQDHAAQESMGRIADRTREHLMHTDKAVVTARLMLLKAIADVQKGDDPPGLGTSFYGLRAIEDIVPTGTQWRDVLGPRLYGAAPAPA